MVDQPSRGLGIEAEGVKGHGNTGNWIGFSASTVLESGLFEYFTSAPSRALSFREFSLEL
jgi:hypothetical protein